MKIKDQTKNNKFYHEILQSHCDVCFTYFRKVQAKKIDEGLEILVCSKCHCKTHKCCYDFQANEVFVSEKIRQFICSRCQRQTLSNKQCFICHQTDGAMIVSQDQEVVHVFCALYHNQIDIISYIPKIKVQKSLSYKQVENPCNICKKPNGFQNCAFENCKMRAHPLCVKKMYIQQEQQNDQPKCWNHHLACGSNNIFDLSDQIISYNLLKDTIKDELSEIQMNAPFQIGNKQQILTKHYNEYLKEANKQKKNSKKIKRGGYSFVSCTEHQFTPYCICNGKGQGGEMVECQCCFTWYHMQCIKYSASSQEPFSCSFCKNFYDLKKKIIDEVINGKNDLYELKCDFPPKISFMDVMWIIRAIDSRIAKGNVVKMLKQLAKYPLRTSKIDKLIKIQNKNKLEILCQEFYQEYFFEEQQFKFFKPLPVLGLDAEKKPIKLQENIQKNKRLREFIVELRNFCKKMGIVDEFKGILNELDFKQNAISDSYEKIIELSKSQQKYQEIPILKIKAQAYSFLQIIKKVNSGSIITINQLQQSVRKANLIQNVPDYLIQPLTQKYNTIKNIITTLQSTIRKDPYNLIQIKQISSKLINQFKIEPPLFYQFYLEQRNFINSLYFYHAKQTGSKIQGQLSLKEKISELETKTQQQNFVCTQQLVKIVNNFLEMKQKTNCSQYSFEQLNSIISNLQRKTVRFQLQNPQGNKSFKKQKLQYLFQKVRQYSIRDNEAEQLFLRYGQIKQMFTQVAGESLENTSDITILTSLDETCNQLIQMLQNYPLKIEDLRNNKPVTWLSQVKYRKQQITQLMILATQSQLDKNPLSLNKLLDSLPRQNSLVKNYKALKKEYQEYQNQYVNALALSSQKMEYFKGQGLKKTRRQQININQLKPDLKRMNQILQSLNHSKVDFSKQIKQITKIINRALDLSYSVEKYCKSKQNFQRCNTIDQLSQARKEIDQLRKKILTHCQISLTKQLIDLYHCQIHNRMRTNLVSGNFDLDKNQKLIKFAQEEGIGTTSTYFKLKQKFETKHQKSKEISLIRNIEGKLKAQAQKQTDPLYKNLYALRKTMQIPEVDQEAPKVSYIEQLKQKNRELKQKITKVLAQGNHPQIRISLDEAKNIYLEALKNPYNLGNLHQFSSQIQKSHNFYSNWKRSSSLGRNTLYNEQKLKEYQKLKFKIDQLQILCKEIYRMKNSLKVLQTIQNIQDQTTEDQNLVQNCLLIEENLQQIQENQSISEDNEMLLVAKKKYLKIWFNLIKYFKRKYDALDQNTVAQNSETSRPIIIGIKKIKKLLYDTYYHLQYQLKFSSNNQQTIAEFKQMITFFQQFFMEIKLNYLESNNYNKESHLMNNWIDLDDLVYELKVGASLDDQFFLYKPFQDLNKFRYRNLSSRNLDILMKITKQQNTFKRSRPDDFNTQLIGDKLNKRPSHISKKQQSSEQQQKISSNIVTQGSRRKIKQILSKNILKNPELKKYGSCQNEVKMIQNQIFGQYHNDLVKYLETSEKFQKLFIKLQQCPEISKKLIKKEFQFKFIKLLVQNLSNISQIQSIMVNKLKEEANVSQFNSSLQASSMASTLKTQKIQQESSNNVLQMLATGNVNETYKKDLAKEMKKIKQGKEKKKKRSKHSRKSRSPSQQAKFSSQSQQENLPSYIEKQYAQEHKKGFESNALDILSNIPRSDQPLMFDPQVDQEKVQDIEKKYPRGSTLKIKKFTLQFMLKNRGKNQFKVNLYTQEDYKRIVSQSVDPGFSLLNIKKQKNQKQILDYLNKPSKKRYKFLICWIEAQNPKQNEFLKQLSEQANQRHKIYGWQNQFIKVHVMSIRQFVQLTRFSSNIPNRTTFKQCQEMFDLQRIICIIQYPAQKIYELKEKFKNFSDIQRVQQTYEVSIPLPSYEAYEPIQHENPYYPTMNDMQNPPALSIKPMSVEDPLIKQTKKVQFQGWSGSNQFQTEASNVTTYSSNNPYQQIRQRMGFGSFSPILTDQQEDEEQKQPKLDLADSILKSFQQKEKLQTPSEFQPPYSRQSYEGSSYGTHKYQHHNYQQEKPRYYNKMMQPQGMNPPSMGQGGNIINPMNRHMNNSLGYQTNRPYNNPRNTNFNNQMNRYPQNQGNYNYQNQYQGGNRNNPMAFNPNRNRNPMFNQNANQMNYQQQQPSTTSNQYQGGYNAGGHNQGYNNPNRYQQQGGYQ